MSAMKELERFNRGRTLLILVIAVIAIIGLLFLGDFDRVVNDQINSGIKTYTGNFACIPPKGKEAADPAVCELGLRTRDNKYYALDTTNIQDANTDIKAEDTIAVTGIMSPVEVGETAWANYEVEGIILVHTLLRTR